METKPAILGYALGRVVDDPRFNASISDVDTDLKDLLIRLETDSQYLQDSGIKLEYILLQCQHFLRLHQNSRSEMVIDAYQATMQSLQNYQERQDRIARVVRALDRLTPKELRDVAQESLTYLLESNLREKGFEILRSLEHIS